MVLELHVWGPGFSLPSIDPHCLAAIAYLQQAVPHGEWQLVASSDPTLSPTHELPALKDGNVWIGGFRNTCHYIAQFSSGEWALDAGLPEKDGADCIAFSSYLESHGQPLLDLSLYVSSENYAAVTRPLFNTIQQFPLPYLTPPSLRAAAKLRTVHLGLSGLDIDADEAVPTEHSIIPESLRTSRVTVSSLLAASPETSARIRLDALSRDFLFPLEELLGKKEYLLSDRQISSLDCLALGYLSLMLVPKLPQPWLSKGMRAGFPALCAWTEEFSAKVFGPTTVTVDDAFLTGATARTEDIPEQRGFLPWVPPRNRDVTGVSSTYLATLADAVPVIGQYRRDLKARQINEATPEEKSYSSWNGLTVFSSLLAGAGLLAGYMFHQGHISLGHEEPEEQSSSGLESFGDAGAALSLYANQMDAQVQMQKEFEANQSYGQPVDGTRPDVTGVSETTR